MTTQEIARICHDANRAYCITQGDKSQLTWDEAPEWQKESAMAGVGEAMRGANPRQLHESWCQFKIDAGWRYGPQKCEYRKTHPCLVAYDELPPEQRLKDALFHAIVAALA